MHKVSFALTCLLVATASFDAKAQSSKELSIDETTWRSKLAPGASLQVFGGVGDVTVVESETDEVVLTVTRGTEGTVVPRVVVAETPKGLTICGDWTTPSGTPSPCATAKKILVKERAQKNYVPLGLLVAVPDGVDVEVNSSNGDIIVGPLTSSVKATTVAGDVRVSSTGRRVHAENHEGVVTLDLVPELIKQSIHASTIRGYVRVSIPESRLVKLDVYARGARVRSAYEIGAGGLLRDGAYEYKGRRTFNATLGPRNSTTWTKLEIFTLDEIFSWIEIVQP